MCEDEETLDNMREHNQCWYCNKPKKNIYGLCTHCGRFGKPDTRRTDIETEGLE